MGHGLFMFNACQDLMPIVWDIPNTKVWLSMPSVWLVLLDIEKTEIHKQTRNSSCFGVAQSDN
jgi:hypothetical protein